MPGRAGRSAARAVTLVVGVVLVVTAVTAYATQRRDVEVVARVTSELCPPAVLPAPHLHPARCMLDVAYEVAGGGRVVAHLDGVPAAAVHGSGGGRTVELHYPVGDPGSPSRQGAGSAGWVVVVVGAYGVLLLLVALAWPHVRRRPAGGGAGRGGPTGR